MCYYSRATSARFLLGTDKPFYPVEGVLLVAFWDAKVKESGQTSGTKSKNNIVQFIENRGMLNDELFDENVN